MKPILNISLTHIYPKKIIWYICNCLLYHLIKIVKDICISIAFDKLFGFYMRSYFSYPTLKIVFKYNIITWLIWAEIHILTNTDNTDDTVENKSDRCAFIMSFTSHRDDVIWTYQPHPNQSYVMINVWIDMINFECESNLNFEWLMLPFVVSWIIFVNIVIYNSTCFWNVVMTF